MHVVSRKDLNSADSETVRISKSPTTVVTANSEVQTKKATVYGRESVTAMLLEDTPAVLPLGNSAKITGVFNYQRTSDQTPHLI